MVMQTHDIRRIQNAEFPVSPVFVINQKAFQATTIDADGHILPKYRYIINQGGARSGKTYSILQIIIIYCLLNRGKIIDIVRKTHAELAESVVQDFIEIIDNLGLTDVIKRNKTKHIFRVNGNTIRFLGMDKAQKKRGSKRDILYVNEANGITLEDWVQLSIRTTGQIFIDFNPSEYFWVYPTILEKENKGENKHFLIKSTYLDNYDFLSPALIKDIEDLIEIDDFYYQVYALGNLAVMKGKIFSKQELIDAEEYDVVDYDELYYGLDFGFEHPTALIECKYAQEKTYERERYYKQHKTDDELIAWMIENEISMTAPIYADPAYPASIRKIKDAGFNVRRAKKDVIDGIRFLQGIVPKICKSSINYIRERASYKWRQKTDGAIIEGEPVKLKDDLIDASRYAHYSHRKRLSA